MWDFITTKPQQSQMEGLRHLTFAFAGAYAPGPPPPSYLAFYTMTLSRHQIRQFIAAVEWATATNLCYLLYGKAGRKQYAMVAAELNRMCQTRRKEIRLKKLHHEFYTCYALATSSRKSINRQHAEHDIRLRDCLGKYFHTCGEGLMEYLSIKTSADALLRLNTGILYFEYDSGHMGKKQLVAKIREHYIGKGAFRVIFFIGTAEYAHWKNRKHIKCLEDRRLRMFFRIVRKLLKDKPNRIAAAGYHKYLEDGKLYGFKTVR